MHRDARGAAHDLFRQRAAAQAREPIRRRTADHDLRDVLASGEAQDLVGQVAPGEARKLRAEALGKPHRLVDALQSPVARLLEIETAEMHRDPGGVEPAREPAAGPHHCLRQGIGADADENALGRWPGAFDGVLAQIDDHLVVDPIGRAPERELAQGGEIAGLEEIVRRAPGILGQIDLAVPAGAA